MGKSIKKKNCEPDQKGTEETEDNKLWENKNPNKIRKQRRKPLKHI